MSTIPPAVTLTDRMLRAFVRVLRIPPVFYGIGAAGPVVGVAMLQNGSLSGFAVALAVPLAIVVGGLYARIYLAGRGLDLPPRKNRRKKDRP